MKTAHVESEDPKPGKGSRRQKNQGKAKGGEIMNCS